MSRTIPTGRVPKIAAWLAAREREQPNTPENRLALTLDVPYWPGEHEPTEKHDPFGDDQRWPQGDPPPYAR
jgi:hypothetical protein